jgi:hypothetical protein
MAGDIVIFDNLSEIRRMMNSDSFAALEKLYDDKLNRASEKALSPKTSDEEAIKAKWQVVALKENHPKKLLEEVLNSVSKNVAKHHPRLIR